MVNGMAALDFLLTWKPDVMGRRLAIQCRVRSSAQTKKSNICLEILRKACIGFTCHVTQMSKFDGVVFCILFEFCGWRRSNRNVPIVQKSLARRDVLLCRWATLSVRGSLS